MCEAGTPCCADYEDSSDLKEKLGLTNEDDEIDSYYDEAEDFRCTKAYTGKKKQKSGTGTGGAGNETRSKSQKEVSEDDSHNEYRQTSKKEKKDDQLRHYSQLSFEPYGKYLIHDIMLQRMIKRIPTITRPGTTPSS